MVLHEAEATWLESLVVQAHVQVPDESNLTEEVIELTLLCVKAEIANV